MTHRAPVGTVTRPTQPLPPAAVDRLADEIAELSSQIDAATHCLLTIIRRFDEGSGWATHGALSCAHWLNWRIGLDLGAARERVRVARALGELPALDAALRRGAISYSKTRAITRVATPANETTLLEMAQHATASQLEKICRGYRRVLAAEQPESLADEELRRFVRFADTDDGMVRIGVRLRPEEARVVLQAIDVARRRAWHSTEPRADVSAETSPDAAHSVAARHAHEPSPALSRADALVVVAESFLSAESEARGARSGGASVAPIELVVHVDKAALRVDPLVHDASDGSAADDAPPDDARHTPDPTRIHATLDDGTAIPLATAQRLACDAAAVTIAQDAHGNVPTLGRRTRRISSTLRRALRVRDDVVRVGQTVRAAREAAAVVAWARGGATTLANLCSLCRRHHRFVHEHGYRIDTSPDGELRFFRRDGSPVPAAGLHASATTSTTAAVHPTSSRAGGTTPVHPDANVDPLTAFRDAQAASGLPAIDAQTAFPRWDGTPADYGLAVQALLRPQLASLPSG